MSFVLSPFRPLLPFLTSNVLCMDKTLLPAEKVPSWHKKKFALSGFAAKGKISSLILHYPAMMSERPSSRYVSDAALCMLHDCRVAETVVGRRGRFPRSDTLKRWIFPKKYTAHFLLSFSFSYFR